MDGAAATGTTQERAADRRRSARRRLLAAIAVGGVLGLGAAAGWRELRTPLDGRAASLCRSVIPALNPEGSTFSIGRPRRSGGADSMRVTYVVHLPDGRVRAREIWCQFDASAPGPARLTDVATERGPMPGASFYFLQRFYLEAKDGPPPDPAASQAIAPTGPGTSQPSSR